MMGTRGTKAKERKAPKPKRRSKEEAQAQAKSIVEQAAKEHDRERQEKKNQKKTNPKTKSTQSPKPAWIQYYERQASEDDSVYGKGFAQTYDYYENDLMGNYIDSKDGFFDTVNQNPEACSILYPDKNGRIRILHHLTAGVDKTAIVAGVEGLGSTSQVKIVNMGTFSDRAEIGAIDADGHIPPIEQFIDSTKETFKRKQFNEGGPKLGKFMETCGTGYLLHPIWLLLIYEGDGKEPQEVAEILIRNLQEAFEEGVKYLHEYETLGDYHEEIHQLLVYLWSCHNNKFSIDHRDILTTSDSQAFDEIRNGIIKKVLLPVYHQKKAPTVRIQDHRGRENSPSPSDSDPDSDSEEEDSYREGREKERSGQKDGTIR